MSAGSVLYGRGAAPGRVQGHALVLRDDELPAVLPGAVLVTRIVHPHHAPLFTLISAVVLEEPTLLQHGTGLAREFGIPAVVGIVDATRALRTGEVIDVDGARGVVRRRAGFA